VNASTTAAFGTRIDARHSPAYPAKTTSSPLGEGSTNGRDDLATQSLALRLRTKRSEMMISELESVALRLFEQRGFDGVTVEDIASEAQISVRTFYRYFPSKEDVLQQQIARRSEGLRAALVTRPLDEPPMHSLRIALAEQISAEETDLLRRWVAVIVATPSVMRAVLGGIQLKTQRVIAEFFGSRLGQPDDALVPTMLAAATQGVIQAAQTQWYFQGGDLANAISAGLEVLESGIGTDPKTWSTWKTAQESVRLDTSGSDE
jgi:TetR/AcrR family transcriptional regulator, regulator of mycofactocin system